MMEKYMKELDAMMKEIRARGLMKEIHRHAKEYGLNHDAAYWHGVVKTILYFNGDKRWCEE